ncbi:transcription elongation regulator [Lunasporangiospora selenospora]|uniref:Transcription elongation regulator n=1 Tax=Lunasporangiospora selenospora TaxID=979761 RepID=A0A9P6KE12_9FUNG|nr:transcription elongation regulator [Lunasporangiospora selenospora]
MPPPHPMPGFPPPGWLPPGWTEHKAPDGMAYYYNASTGTSSWVRPTVAPPPPGMGMPPPHYQQPLPPPPPGMTNYSAHQPQYPPGVSVPPPTITAPTASTEVSAKSSKPAKKAKKEKAVRKTRVLESPWYIVVTSYENTYYYNKETKVSLWIPTPELEQALIMMGEAETKKLQQESDRIAKEEQEKEEERFKIHKRPLDGSGGSELQEKRSKNEQDQVGTEMTEDDIAWQLAAMEGMDDQDIEMQGAADSDDNSEDDDQDGAVNARLRALQGSAPIKLDIHPDNIQEREAAFLDMMRDRDVTQFDTWERAYEKIESDPRAYLIPSNKDQQALFESYCVIRASEVRESKEKDKREKEKLEKERKERDKKAKDPKISSSSSGSPEDVYRRLVEGYTTEKSNWVDFMTKHRVDPRFVNLRPGSLRESIFRQYLSDFKKGIIKPKSSSERQSKSSSHSSRHTSSPSTPSSSSSKKYKAKPEEVEEFMSLLRETKKDILHEHKNSSSVEWRKIKRSIDRDRRYDAVGSSTERELIFREYADQVIQRRDEK